MPMHSGRACSRTQLDGPVAEPSEVNVDVVAVSRTKDHQICERFVRLRHHSLLPPHYHNLNQVVSEPLFSDFQQSLEI